MTKPKQQSDEESVARRRVEQLLLEGLDSGKPIEVTEEWWREKRRELVEKTSKERHARR